MSGMTARPGHPGGRIPRKPPKISRGGKAPGNLTPRQASFAMELAAGLTQRAAYAAVYGPDVATSGVASRAARVPAVAEEVRRLRDLAAGAATTVTHDEVVTRLREAYAQAEAKRMPGHMVSAALGLAKVAGLLVEQIEQTVTPGVLVVPARWSDQEALTVMDQAEALPAEAGAAAGQGGA